MKAYKTINFRFSRDEIITVQSLLNLLGSFGEDEWEELNAQATDMDDLYIRTQEFLDFMRLRLE